MVLLGSSPPYPTTPFQAAALVSVTPKISAVPPSATDTGTDAQTAGMEGARNSSSYGSGRLGCGFWGFFKETGKNKEVNTPVMGYH